MSDHESKSAGFPSQPKRKLSIDPDNSRDLARPRPILVVGMNRSGTKWLSNLLCNHPACVGAQANHHFGMIETNMLHQMQHLFPTLSFDDNFAGLVELWSNTDFFEAANGSKEFLYKLDPRPTSVTQLFKVFMNDFAERHGAKYWVQKCSPVFLLPLIDEYQDAIVVTIQRDLVATLESTIANETRSNTTPSVIRKAYSYALQEKMLRHIEQRTNSIRMSYESFSHSPLDALQQLTPRLDLDFDDTMLEIPYQRNTSFASGPRLVLSSGERMKAQLVRAACRFVPLRLMRMGRAAMTNRNQQRRFSSGTFHNALSRHDPIHCAATDRVLSDESRQVDTLLDD